tara:strand:- start:419 stop:625 length:207 start_codon:yes stop_codon:yes gene_type:complete
MPLALSEIRNRLIWISCGRNSSNSSFFDVEGLGFNADSTLAFSSDAHGTVAFSGNATLSLAEVGYNFG